MYYDAGKSLGYPSAWIYYTVSRKSEGHTTQNYNCFTLSFSRVDTDGETVGTRFLKYDSDYLGFGSLAAGRETPTSAYKTTDGDYYFTLLSREGSNGVASITDGVAGSYYIYNPKNQKYLTYDSSAYGSGYSEFNVRAIFTSNIEDARKWTVSGSH